MRVEGNCPMGCGKTLFLGTGERVTCSFIDCPEPNAVDLILGDPETEEHIVLVGEESFSILHPLRERLAQVKANFAPELFACELHRWLSAQPGPPFRPGRYRALEQSGDPVAPWRFVEVK
jgi:hypothetical protein